MRDLTIGLIAACFSTGAVACGNDDPANAGRQDGGTDAAFEAGGATGGASGASGAPSAGGAPGGDASATGGVPGSGGAAADSGQMGDSASDAAPTSDASEAGDAMNPSDGGPDVSTPQVDSSVGMEAGPDSGADAERGGPEGGQTPVDSGLGVPILAPDFQWTWVPIEGMKCRDGSATGIGVNLNSASDKVVISLDGGGACFTPDSCPTVFESFGPTEFGSGPTQGIYNRNAAGNPVSDWSFFYIPHCTGDGYAGGNPGGDPGIGPQQFVGYENVELALRRIIPTVAASQVVLAGISAGGSGALANYDVAATLYGDIPVVLLDDSGPPLTGSYLGNCLQNYWRTLWGFDETFLASCGASCPNGDDYIYDLSVFLENKYPGRTFGLVSSLEDIELRVFYALGQTGCQVPEDAGAGPLLLPPGLLTEGLLDFRSNTGFGTYYIDSSVHSWLSSDRMYGATVSTDGGTVALTAWLADVISGEVSHVGP